MCNKEFAFGDVVLVSNVDDEQYGIIDGSLGILGYVSEDGRDIRVDLYYEEGVDIHTDYDFDEELPDCDFFYTGSISVNPDQIEHAKDEERVNRLLTEKM